MRKPENSSVTSTFTREPLGTLCTTKEQLCYSRRPFRADTWTQREEQHFCCNTVHTGMLRVLSATNNILLTITIQPGPLPADIAQQVVTVTAQLGPSYGIIHQISLPLLKSACQGRKHKSCVCWLSNVQDVGKAEQDLAAWIADASPDRAGHQEAARLLNMAEGTKVKYNFEMS